MEIISRKSKHAENFIRTITPDPPYLQNRLGKEKVRQIKSISNRNSLNVRFPLESSPSEIPLHVESYPHENPSSPQPPPP